MCEHITLQRYWNFSFWSLFETQNCNACGGRFSVPLRQQYLVFVLSIAAVAAVVFVGSFLDLPFGRTGEIIQRIITMLLAIEIPHRLAYRTYAREFQRAREAKTFHNAEKSE